MTQLSVVVTCTERKVMRARPELQVRTLPSGTVSSRVRRWCSLLDAEAATLPLNELYQGEHWVQAKTLLGAAEAAGFSPRLWVASAGVGLQPATDTYPSYAATFSPRHADTVADTSDDRRLWWQNLAERMGNQKLVDLAAKGPVLLVLSEVYASVLQFDLVELGKAGSDVLLVGGLTDIEGIHRVPANGALRSALGGTLTGLNVRMAASWLEHCRNGELAGSSTVAAWGRWAASAARTERYDRQPLTDAQVKAFIRQSVQVYPDYSRTKLHRLLRDSGRACEQKRFAALYTETMGE
ncbi:hypothetical protein [Amycolatopsis nigrescens]|uniref:hypothetical protein n=1 Tax=Amycolatopsis nigrescens TaxID=381445 RepID=UPI00047556A9|nr:hypothetical protein [Amycolatopsis nigrescens]